MTFTVTQRWRTTVFSSVSNSNSLSTLWRNINQCIVCILVWLSNIHYFTNSVNSWLGPLTSWCLNWLPCNLKSLPIDLWSGRIYFGWSILQNKHKYTNLQQYVVQNIIVVSPTWHLSQSAFWQILVFSFLTEHEKDWYHSHICTKTMKLQAAAT